MQRELETGEKFYCEQISHHPPITAFQIEGPNGEFSFSGHHRLKAKFDGASSLAGHKEGSSKMTFQDGTEFIIKELPHLSLEDLLRSKRRQVYYKESLIYDKTNDIYLRVHYNPNFNNSYKGTAYRWTIGWATGGGKDLGKNEH